MSFLPGRVGSTDLVVADLEALLDELEGDRAMLGELLRLFVLEADERMGQARRAVADRNPAGVRAAAHALKGAAAQIRAPRAHAVLSALEEVARRPDLPGAPEVLAQAQGEVDLLVASVRQLLAGGAS